MIERPSSAWLAVGATVLACALFVDAGGLDDLGAPSFVAVAGILFGLHHYRRWPTWARASYVGFLALAAAGFGERIVRIVRQNLAVPPEWDFLGFWIHARTAVLGGSFYDPSYTRLIAADIPLTEEFRHEIVNVAFWYPPPSMFLFWPLGWFEPATALALWYGALVLALAAATWLLWRVFFPAGSAIELAGCAALVVVANGTYLTFHYGQTNFFALLALLCYWRRRDTWGGGAWTAVATLVKPFLAVLLLVPALGARLRVLAGAIVATVVLTIASVVAFGTQTVADYATGDQVGVKPEWIYDEPTNQSLLGLVLRVTGSDCHGFACLTNPWYLTGVVVLGAVTLLLGLALRRADEEWALGLYVAFALLAYPVSQLFYSVLLIPLALLAWRRRLEIPGGPLATALAIALVYALAIVDEGLSTVWAYAAAWLGLAAVALTRRASLRL